MTTTIPLAGASFPANVDQTEFERALKIVVAGPFDSGKTRFISTVSDIATLQTEVPNTTAIESGKLTTTVALDFGLVRLNSGQTVYLFGTPGQTRFEFMWEILTMGMHGLIFLVDGSNADCFEGARVMLDYYRRRHHVPIVVGANKQDLAGTHPLDVIRAALALPQTAPLLPISAVNKDSAMQVVRCIAELIAP